tara:strand:- start:3229 stop:3549 length:321 start_codon:yes stop_codon:yes gene_type:complete
MKKFKQVQTISDKSLEPFFITKDDYSYTVKERIVPKSNHFRTVGKGKKYEKSLCYYPSFEQCLEKITRLKMDAKAEYTSIEQYNYEFREINNQLINFLQNEFRSTL